MKNVVRYAVFCSIMISTSRCSVDPMPCMVQPGIDVVHVDPTAKAIVEQLFSSGEITRKKHHTLSVILHGIAQALLSLGQILGAQSSHEKQQGVATVLGTVVAVAAQLSEKTDVQQRQTQEALLVDQPLQLQVGIVALTEAVIDQLDKEQIKGLVPLSKYLAMVKQLAKSDRPSLIKMLLSSPHSKQFLKEVFTAAFGYIEHNMPTVLAMIKDRIKAYVASFEQQQAGTSKKSDIIAHARALEIVEMSIVTYACCHIRSLLLQSVDEPNKLFLMRHIPNYCQDHCSVSCCGLDQMVRQENKWLLLYMYRSSCRAVEGIKA